MIEASRELVDEHGRMPVPAAGLNPIRTSTPPVSPRSRRCSSCWRSRSISTLEFPERMLNRRSFASLSAIAACVNEIEPARLAS